MPTGKLHVVPLGGLGEFGMNCMAVRWGDDIFVVDAGLMFPEAELLGVDIVVPEISYLIENRQHVRGIVLTHGHEDHIGALPWILSELNVPGWGTEFTLAYGEDKLDEHGLLDYAELFARTERRIFISCFASSIHRIKLAVEMAFEHGRKVAFLGRSMNNSSEIAEDLGYIEIPEGLLINPGEIKNFAPEKVCVMISGTQGEPMSALSRAAVDNHKHAKIEKGDTVVLSSRIIPGNEKA